MNKALIIALFLFLSSLGYIPPARTMILMLPVDTIPVVIHVIHTGTYVGSPENPSDSIINEMLNQVNDVFQLNGPLYGGAEVGFEFQLAHRSPDCNFTTGINRVDGSNIPKYTTGGITSDTVVFPNSAFEIPVKSLSIWPNTDYLNIWIVNTIDDNPDYPGGYAYFPEYNSALTDGIVLRASVVNGTNKTIIHELGHYFSLLHTFGNAWSACLTETDCLADGDLICDTENCTYAFDCSSTINPCTSEEWLIADPEYNYTVLNNYMGYTNCQWMFTDDQNARMHYALNTFRPGLLSSMAVETNTPLVPSEACMPTAINGLSPYYGIQRVEIGSLDVYSNSSMADGAFYFDRSCNQQVEVQAGDSLPVRITCSFENYSQVKLYLDTNNDGTFSLPEELFIDAMGGVVEDTIMIPLTPIAMCTPLRLRVVVDHPVAPSPTACLLTGTVAEGVGQIEDYTLIIKPRVIESVNTGVWNVPGNWSCNCIPSATDAIRIKTGHTITIPSSDMMECAGLYLEPGALLQMEGDMHVAGGCN